MVHSGLLESLSMPRKIKCSSGILSSHSLISLALSLCSPLSAFFSLNVDGLSSMILPCSFSRTHAVLDHDVMDAISVVILLRFLRVKRVSLW